MADEQIPVLDVRGEICPYPMLKTNEALDGDQKDVQVLDVLTDHPPALSTVPPQAMSKAVRQAMIKAMSRVVALFTALVCLPLKMLYRTVRSERYDNYLPIKNLT